MVNNSLDAVYGALADPTRRGMLERLRRGPLTVSELGGPTGMTLAGVDSGSASTLSVWARSVALMPVEMVLGKGRGRR